MGIRDDEGLGTLLAIMALSLFSLLSFYMMLSATTEVRIADNHESDLQARYAAQAGLNHARAVLRGLRFDDVLAGPDGAHDGSAAYLAYARSYAFRNPIGWPVAVSLDITDAAAGLS